VPPGVTTPYGGTSIPNGDHLPYYTQVNFGSTHVFHLNGAGMLTARFYVIDLFDKVYQIRNGTVWASGHRSTGHDEASSLACRNRSDQQASVLSHPKKTRRRGGSSLTRARCTK
jgi:hypothetical protein